MAFLQLVKVLRDVLGKMPNLNPVQWSQPFVGRFERFARPALYLYSRVLWRWKNYYGRKGIFKNKEKSSEIHNQMHT